MTPKRLREMNLKRLGHNWYQVQIPPGYLASRIMPSTPTSAGAGIAGTAISDPHPDVPA
jgi:hypothetical protein